jgi:5-(carboxyamino)imidazole ribonucleotide mutase
MVNPAVWILMGSQSDLEKMNKAAVAFEEMDVAYEMKILSAHRLPDMTADYAHSARERGLQVIICGAGMAAHLAGAVAAQTTLPVIGVPLASGPLSGVDALYATVQMPSGITWKGFDGTNNPLRQNFPWKLLTRPRRNMNRR